MLRPIVVSLGLGVVVVACSSIPDVVFVDDAGATSGGPSDGSSSDEASSSGTSTSGTVPFDGGADVTYSCPDKPPPAGVGICCSGDRLCLGCQETNCSNCPSCGDGNVCCARNPQKVDCKAASSCSR